MFRNADGSFDNLKKPHLLFLAESCSNTGFPDDWTDPSFEFPNPKLVATAEALLPEQVIKMMSTTTTTTTTMLNDNNNDYWQ